MDITKTEEKILKKIGEVKLTTKVELKNTLNNPDSTGIVDSATQNLIEKNLIRAINPLGSTCFIITRKGNKLLKDLSV
jgi:predicted transcriptional regulator